MTYCKIYYTVNSRLTWVIRSVFCRKRVNETMEVTLEWREYTSRVVSTVYFTLSRKHVRQNVQVIQVRGRRSMLCREWNVLYFIALDNGRLSSFCFKYIPDSSHFIWLFFKARPNRVTWKLSAILHRVILKTCYINECRRELTVFLRARQILYIYYAPIESWIWHFVHVIS